MPFAENVVVRTGLAVDLRRCRGQSFDVLLIFGSLTWAAAAEEEGPCRVRWGPTSGNANGVVVLEINVTQVNVSDALSFVDDHRHHLAGPRCD